MLAISPRRVTSLVSKPQFLPLHTTQKVVLKIPGMPILKTFRGLPTALRLTPPMRPQLGGLFPASSSSPLTLLPPPPGRLAAFPISQMCLAHCPWCLLQPPLTWPTPVILRPQTAFTPGSYLCLPACLPACPRTPVSTSWSESWAPWFDWNCSLWVSLTRL